MKLAPVLFLVTCFAINVSAQKVTRVQKASQHSTYVKGDNFEGVIFDRSYTSRYMPLDTNLKRVTPDIKEIESVEKALISQLKKLNKRHTYQLAVSGVIDRRLNNYRRQYIGFINAKGDRCVFLNCFYKDDRFQNKWRSDYYFVFDGGASVWRVTFNLNTGKLYGFNTNGLA